MNDPQPSPTPPKMPASHKWAVICFFLTAGVNILLNFLGHWDPLGVLVTLTSLAGLLAILFFRRSPRTYTVGVIAMLFFILRAGQSTCSGIWLQWQGEGMGWWHVAINGWVFFLFILLFRAYVFGAASRQYYGFPSVPVRRVRIDAFETADVEPSKE